MDSAAARHLALELAEIKKSTHALQRAAQVSRSTINVDGADVAIPDVIQTGVDAAVAVDDLRGDFDGSMGDIEDVLGDISDQARDELDALNATAAAPVGLVVAVNAAEWGPSGIVATTVSLSWDAVTEDVDGAPLIHTGYDVESTVLGDAIIDGQTDVESYTTTAWAPGVARSVRVRARVGFTPGEWSEPITVTPVFPEQTTTAPTPPMLTTGGGGVFIGWDGLLTTGATPAGFQGVFAEYRIGTTGAFVRAAGPLSAGAGQVAQVRATMGDVVQARLRWMDNLGRVSNVSDQRQITTKGIEMVDLDQEITNAIDEIGAKADAAVVSAVDEYAVSASSTVAPTAGWSTATPAWSTTNFIWRRGRTSYADGSTTVSSPAVLTGNPGATGATGSPGAPGAPGADGRGIASTTVTYQASASGETAPTGTWSATVPAVAAGQFLWTRTVITFTDGASTTAYSVGRQGENGATGATGATGAPGATGATGVSVSSVTRYYFLTAGSQPAKPTTLLPPAPWQTTEPTYTAGSNDKLYVVDRVVFSNNTFAYGDVSLSANFEAAKTAWVLANNALTSANGKTKVIWSTSAASGTGYGAGDVWFQTNSGVVIGQWEYTTSWQSRPIGHQAIASIDAGKITVGYLDVANRIKANSIAAQQLLVGDFQNYFNDPTFAHPSGYSPWTVVAGGIEKNGTATQHGAYIASTEFTVSAGDKFQVTATRTDLAGATGTATIHATYRNSAGAWVYLTALLSLTSAGTFSKELVIPAGAFAVRLGFYTETNMPTTTKVRITDVVIRRKVAGELIVDGAVLARHVTMDQGFADKFWANEGNFGKVSTDMVTPNFGANLDIAANGSVNILTGTAANALDAANQADRKAEAAGVAAGVTAERAAEAAASAAAAISTVENQGRYYRFSETDLRIGRPGSAVELSVADTGISFRQNDVPVSLWDGGQMIVKSFVGEEVVLANHKIETRGARTIVRSM